MQQSTHGHSATHCLCAAGSARTCSKAPMAIRHSQLVRGGERAAMQQRTHGHSPPTACARRGARGHAAKHPYAAKPIVMRNKRQAIHGERVHMPARSGKHHSWLLLSQNRRRQEMQIAGYAGNRESTERASHAIAACAPAAAERHHSCAAATRDTTRSSGTQDTGTQDIGTEDTGTQDTGTRDTGMQDTQQLGWSGMRAHSGRGAPLTCSQTRRHAQPGNPAWSRSCRCSCRPRSAAGTAPPHPSPAPGRGHAQCLCRAEL